MPDETVETRPPWLDFSLPRRPCLGISVLCSIILQSLNSCAIRLPDSTACPHHLLPPLTLRLIMCWSSPAVRTARCSQPAMLPTRHTKFAGWYAVCSEENYELPRGSIFPINTKSPGISTNYPHMGSWLTS